uniref:Nuclear receptor domain-containing protein n=1 Tax=Panagrolaimus sp. PS1159 TaxID=55785 RepID=A0AC35GI35_9BILA
MDSSQSSSSPYLSPQNELKESEPCLICGAPTLERHFQVISCNACAAFFRRSVKIRSSYKCQRNQGNCSINIRISFLSKLCKRHKR